MYILLDLFKSMYVLSPKIIKLLHQVKKKKSKKQMTAEFYLKGFPSHPLSITFQKPLTLNQKKKNQIPTTSPPLIYLTRFPDWYSARSAAVTWSSPFAEPSGKPSTPRTEPSLRLSDMVDPRDVIRCNQFCTDCHQRTWLMNMFSACQEAPSAFFSLNYATASVIELQSTSFASHPIRLWIIIKAKIRNAKNLPKYYLGMWHLFRIPPTLGQASLPMLPR